MKKENFNGQTLKTFIFAVIFVVWFLVVLFQFNNISKIYSDNLNNEIMNYKLLKYLIMNYHGDETFPSLQRDVLSSQDWQSNLKSHEKYLTDNGVKVDILSEDDLKEFKDIYKESHITFDYTKYDNGGMIYFSQEKGEVTRLLYHTFNDIGKELSEQSHSGFLSYEDQITLMKKGIVKHSLYILISTAIFIGSYYVIVKMDLKMKKISSINDIVMIITIFIITLFFGWMFLNKSADLMNYGTFYSEAWKIVGKDIVEMDVYKFMINFLKDYIFEYVTFFLLLITLGEFIYARMEYKDKESVAANLFLLLLEGFKSKKG